MIEELISSLRQAVRSEYRRPSAVLFSGGVDSAVVAFLARECGEVRAYVGGVRGSHDILWATRAAELIGVPLKAIIFEEGEVLSAAAELYGRYGMGVVDVSFETPLYLTLRGIEEDVVFAGQGADELFGGYSKYLQNPELMKKDLSRVIDVVSVREREIARSVGKKLVMPYLDPRVLRVAREIPADLKIRDGVRKYVLRVVAERLGLPQEIAWKEKKAAQYGSGVMRVLRKEARRRGMSIEAMLRELSSSCISRNRTEP